MESLSSHMTAAAVATRNLFVADTLNAAGFATLLIDLLTAEEERVDVRPREYRFDIELLTSRLLDCTDWLTRDAELLQLSVGYFGASTGAAAALKAAARRPKVRAVVSRGGRPDLARSELALVEGMCDRAILPEIALAHFRAAFPGGAVVELPHGGHFSPQDQPATLVALIEQFL
jgi:pimeloyl-ACP methyl ester carboxylesterase